MGNSTNSHLAMTYQCTASNPKYTLIL